MHILLLSAYDTASHRAWCEGLMRHMPQIHWHYLALPGRYFSWRIRGNAMSWAYGEASKTLNQSFDLIIATSMVDLATLKGLVPSLVNVPSIVYFHENQFAYPSTTHQHKSLEPQMVNLYSALSADHVVFNSDYNRQSLLSGISQLMKKLPDQVPPNLANIIQAKSRVLPVPIESLKLAPTNTSEKKGRLKLVWNHRWEYDKGPDTLASVCREIDLRNLPVDIWILGQAFRQRPSSFQQLQEDPPKCLQHMGKLEQASDYQTCLQQADIVLSTALHEFQGLAVLEAAQQGCVPLVPDRLAYPEWVPEACRYTDTQSVDLEAQAICNRLQIWLDAGLPAAPDVSHYQWNQLLPKYEKLLSEISGKSVQDC